MTAKRILVVEDEFLIAVDTEEVLIEMGYEVVGPALTLADGLEAAERGGIDAALLDVNLTEGTSRPIAELLTARGVPIAYATGYGASIQHMDFPPGPVLSKPVSERDLAATLGSLLKRPAAETI